METAYHRVAFKQCVNGLNGRLGEQCLLQAYSIITSQAYYKLIHDKSSLYSGLKTKKKSLLNYNPSLLQAY